MGIQPATIYGRLGNDNNPPATNIFPCMSHRPAFGSHLFGTIAMMEFVLENPLHSSAFLASLPPNGALPKLFQRFPALPSGALPKLFISYSFLSIHAAPSLSPNYFQPFPFSPRCPCTLPSRSRGEATETRTQASEMLLGKKRLINVGKEKHLWELPVLR